MPFDFLKYLQPTHYFRLFTQSNKTVFPKVEHLSDEVKSLLKPDDGYETPQAKDYDLSWQAVQNGYIGNAEVYTEFSKLSAKDNYRFIRKNFNAAWVAYVLLLRLLSLKNPFSEIPAWFHTRSVKREPIVPLQTFDNDFKNYDSALLKTNPLVSVIIPTLNRYGYLDTVLKDFELQEFKNFEVIVVDQSDNFDKTFYDAFNLDIHLIRHEEKALWLARNTAIQNAKGDLIALSEDDVRIAPDWLGNHIKCLDFFNAEVSAGVFYPKASGMPKERSFFAIASQFATGNAMLYKHVFKRVGLFDRQFERQRMGDGEFGMRIYQADFKSISNPKAYCIDVKAGVGGLREMGSWDAFRPSNFFAPRPIPSVLYFFRRYFGNKAARLALIRMVPISVFPYKFKTNKALLLVGIVVSVLLLPIVAYQVTKSWHLATKKIKDGPLIPELK